MEWATALGLPCACGAIMVIANCRVNMIGCSCRTASKSQMVANTSCSTRCSSGGRHSDPGARRLLEPRGPGSLRSPAHRLPSTSSLKDREIRPVPAIAWLDRTFHPEGLVGAGSRWFSPRPNTPG